MTVRELIARAMPLLPVGAIVTARALTDGLDLSYRGIGPNDVLGLALIVYAGVLFLMRPRALGIALAILVVTAVWAAIGTAEFGIVPWLEWARVLSIVSVTAIVLLSRGSVRARDAALAVEFIAAVPAVVAIVQLATDTGIVLRGDIRAVGTLAHPNSAGMLFALAVFAAVVRLAGRRTWLDALLGLVAAVGLVATQSLGGIAALLAMILVFVFAYRPFRWRTRAIVAALIVGIPVAVLLSPIGQSRLAGWGLADGADRGSAVDSLSWRFETWARLWEVSGQAPWLGRGLGATTAGTIVENNLPHNEYLRALVEVGWVGSIGICALIVVAIVLAIRAATRPHAGWGPAIILGTIAGLLVDSLVANTLLYTVPSYAAALLVAGCVRDRDASDSPT